MFFFSCVCHWQCLTNTSHHGYRPHSQCRVPTRSDWHNGHWSAVSSTKYCISAIQYLVVLSSQPSTVASHGTVSLRATYATLPRCQWVTSSFARPAGLWSVEFECCSLQLQQSTQHCSALGAVDWLEWLNWTQWSGVSGLRERNCWNLRNVQSSLVLSSILL